MKPVLKVSKRGVRLGVVFAERQPSIGTGELGFDLPDARGVGFDP